MVSAVFLFSENDGFEWSYFRQPADRFSYLS